MDFQSLCEILTFFIFQFGTFFLSVSEMIIEEIFVGILKTLSNPQI